MSQDRSGDGLLIGILVLMVFLVVGGLGITWFRVQAERVAREQAIMELERARLAEEQTRLHLRALEDARPAVSATESIQSQSSDE